MTNSVRWSLFMWGVISVRAQSQVITPGVTPLWPCYSAYKLSPTPIQLEFNYSDTPLPTSYVAWYHRSPGWNTVPVTQCAFVIEAPVNYTLLLQLHQVEFADSSGNCSASAVRIYNYNTRGDLVLVNATCESSVLGLPVSTDTNTALVTTFLGRGQFGLRVTVVAREGTLDMTGQGGSTQGSTQGNTQGSTQGNTQGNTQGSTQGTTQNNTQGNTQGVGVPTNLRTEPDQEGYEISSGAEEGNKLSSGPSGPEEGNGISSGPEEGYGISPGPEEGDEISSGPSGEEEGTKYLQERSGTWLD